MKIFWSWQSDTPGKTGRFVVRDALNDAIAELKESPDIIEEPTTAEAREALHLDQDIQGTTGSPDLAQTIFDKINASTVVVADVTMVGAVVPPGAPAPATDKKRLINSNVAIELGYALRALDTNHVVLVFNRHYGVHEDLPFDLRHKGGAVTFNLGPGADAKTIKEQRNELRARFVQALKPFLQTSAPTAAFVETSTTFSPAAYFEKGGVLASRDGTSGEQVAFSYNTDQLCYLRLIPLRPLAAPLQLSAIRGAASTAPLLTGDYGSVVERNVFGAIAMQAESYPPDGPTSISASTQLFTNGEIWAISVVLIAERSPGRPPDLKYPFLPSLLFEQMYYQKLEQLLTFARKELNLSGPWQVECGLTGSAGLHIAISNRFQEFWGPIHVAQIVRRTVLNKTERESINAVLLDYFEAVYDAAGKQRPERLFGFPPGPPKQ